MRPNRSYLAAFAAFIIVAITTYGLVHYIVTSRSSVSSPIEIVQEVKGEDTVVQDAMQVLMTTRVCGSPAVDGYIHVDSKCLRESPTAQWWQNTNPDSIKDLVTHIEHRADYDGIAVAWGIDNKKSSVEECAAACRAHKMDLNDIWGNGALPCNAFVWCSADVCFEPDAHKHTKGDCWLKFTEAPASPEVNMRGLISVAQGWRHRNAPKEVQWHAGVLLPRGTRMTNGTWSPRYEW